MNSLFNGNVMGQAMSAMMSGQSPQQFLMNLAKTHPQLKGMDFSNLQNVAQNLCNKKGVNMNDEIAKIKSSLPN